MQMRELVRRGLLPPTPVVRHWRSCCLRARANPAFSTGVILEQLPVDRLVAGLPQAIGNLSEDNWLNAANAIMTTDTQPKAASSEVQIAGKTVRMTGISNVGAGMIKPNMATMLGYLALDAKVAQSVLDHMVKQAADLSFNAITIDGDTSTNDSFMLIAAGAGALEVNEIDSPEYLALAEAVTALSQKLAHMIVRDGEGATKFMTIQIEEGRDSEGVAKLLTRLRIHPWSKPLSLLLTPIWAGFWRQLVMPASVIWMYRKSTSSWMMSGLPKWWTQS